MEKIIYDIPINDYHLYDYISDNHLLTNQVSTKKQVDKIFEDFLRELPCRINEFSKIVPSNIRLDYSYSSIQYLDIWLHNILDNYRENYHTKINSSSNRILPKIFVSISTDVTIYFVETLRRLYATDIIWINGHYKKNRSAGYPQVTSKVFSDNLTMLDVYNSTWIAPYTIYNRMVWRVFYYNPETHNLIGDIDNIYKLILNLESWEEIVPEEYRYPKF